jgi:hypothetical protein
MVLEASHNACVDYGALHTFNSLVRRLLNAHPAGKFRIKYHTQHIRDTHHAFADQAEMQGTYSIEIIDMYSIDSSYHSLKNFLPIAQCIGVSRIKVNRDRQ